MKRPSKKGRRRRQKASRRELRKRRERAQHGRRFGEEVQQQNRGLPENARLAYPTKIVDIELLGDLRLTGVPDPRFALEQLLELDTRPDQPTRVRVDLRALSRIDAAALLFLVSRIKRFGGIPDVKNVSGSWPSSPATALMMRDANFGGFIAGAAPIESTEKVLQLAHRAAKPGPSAAASMRVDPRVAQRINRFLRARHPALDMYEVDSLGLAINECLENVRQHAYENPDWNEGWFVVGLYDDEKKRSSVAILDFGVGIRATLRRQFGDFLGNLFREPADYLERAIKGIRTATGKAHRGQGFKFLREFVGAEDGRFLHVLSSGGMVTVGRDLLKKLSTPTFRGTIVCLETTNRAKS